MHETIANKYAVQDFRYVKEEVSGNNDGTREPRYLPQTLVVTCMKKTQDLSEGLLKDCNNMQ